MHVVIYHSAGGVHDLHFPCTIIRSAARQCYFFSNRHLCLRCFVFFLHCDCYIAIVIQKSSTRSEDLIRRYKGDGDKISFRSSSTGPRRTGSRTSSLNPSHKHNPPASTTTATANRAAKAKRKITYNPQTNKRFRPHQKTPPQKEDVWISDSLNQCILLFLGRIIGLSSFLLSCWLYVLCAVCAFPFDFGAVDGGRRIRKRMYENESR